MLPSSLIASCACVCEAADDADHEESDSGYDFDSLQAEDAKVS